MLNSNKWNGWLFNTATEWSENHFELPVVDFQHANKINNNIMKTLFTLNSEFNEFIKDITKS